MVLFPNCKINLGLRIKEKRTDGYHNLETIFFPLQLRDAVELIRAGAPGTGRENPFRLTLSGTPVPGTPEDNLCTRAWKMIKKDFPAIPPLNLYLHKVIPSGGGLGGGSSDGTHTLLLLNAVLDLQLSEAQLQDYAARLGSDCPFFLLNKPCLATGRGEVLEELNLDLGNYYFVLVDPQIPVSTAGAFSMASPSTTITPTLKEIVSLPVTQWKELLINEFETPVYKQHPLLPELKEKLYREGAVYASMTGTGSCIYGIFDKRDAIASLRRNFQPYRIYILNRNP